MLVVVVVFRLLSRLLCARVGQIVYRLLEENDFFIVAGSFAVLETLVHLHFLAPAHTHALALTHFHLPTLHTGRP